jgi:hypothetical protein
VKPHDLDLVSLVTGLLFLAIGVLAVVAGATDLDFDKRWIGPAVLITIGVGGVGTVALGEVRSRRSR